MDGQHEKFTWGGIKQEMYNYVLSVFEEEDPAYKAHCEILLNWWDE